MGAICADVKKVTATNSKDLAKQDDEYSDHRPCSTNLAPSDFNIFGPLKDALRRRRFEDDDELKHSVREELRRFSKELRRRACSVSCNDGKIVLIMKDALWENNINLVKDVPMIYVKFIVTDNVVSE